jgi:DNA-nicking Smr family endonuclease
LPIEAEIDLHGYTQEEAHRVLSAFIAGHAAAGRRCVRVITGKGSFREGGGVLKSAVPRWLNEQPLQDRILAFTHARRDDGGEGALYVLLRRKRTRSESR